MYYHHPNMKKLFSKKGFTLLEMLIVIGIIAILVAMGAVSYSTAQKKARDARRRADITAIQKAMEQYYAICHFKYPVITGGQFDTNNQFSSGFITSNAVDGCTDGQVLMKTVPNDPLGGFYKCPSCDQSQFTICPPLDTKGPGGASSYFETFITTSTSQCASSQQ